jgi:hypothetical protein
MMSSKARLENAPLLVSRDDRGRVGPAKVPTTDGQPVGGPISRKWDTFAYWPKRLAY